MPGAIGVLLSHPVVTALMFNHGLTADAAFEVLRRYSQDFNIRVRDLAVTIVDTLPRWAGGSPRARACRP